MMRFAVLLGASKGMGFAVAQKLGREGFELLLVSRKPEDAARRLREAGIPADTLAGAIEHPETAERIAAWASERGGIHALLLNHGGPPVGKLEKLSEDVWRTWFEVMVVGPLRILRVLRPLLAKARPGRVVAITSFTVRDPVPGMALSNALRAALTNALFTAAQEWGEEGILINTVAPGYIRTERLQGWLEAQARLRDRSVEDLENDLRTGLALKRIGEPDDIAEVIAFLLSRNTYITGREIPVDGGR